VKGLTLGKHKLFLEEIIEAFKSCGYDIRLPWQVLNAASYGVPQNRERLFLLGAKKGLPVPKYPAPATRAAGRAAGTQERLLGLPMGPSCKDAIDDIPNAENFQELIEDDSAYTNEWQEPSSYAAELRCSEDKHWHFGYRREWDKNILTSSIRTYHTEISRKRFQETLPGSVEPISRFFRLPENGVSNTLRAGTDSARGAFTSPRPIHYRYPRCITVREMARLHGFPDWFRLQKTKWHGARQIGNAVPPPLARAIANEIMEAMRMKPSPPKTIIDLGHESLLSMDMSEAAAYWGTSIIIGRRNKKSGAKKRRQAEIELQRLLLREETAAYG
jgi:DNA (cytosine-5)-methyltransferase 1